MDIFGKLLMGACLKKAAALEQWLFAHRGHGSIAVDHSNDGCHVHVACGCGMELELTIIVDVILRTDSRDREAVGAKS